MDTRTFFIVGLAVIGYFLWQAWQEDYAAPPAQPFTEIVADNSAADSDVIEAVADTSAVSADPTSERPGSYLSPAARPAKPAAPARWPRSPSKATCCVCI